jgi:hypothetical protein
MSLPSAVRARVKSEVVRVKSPLTLKVILTGEPSSTVEGAGSVVHEVNNEAVVRMATSRAVVINCFIVV